MKTSARNQLAGTVSKLTLGAVNAEVVIQLSGGNTVCVIITLDSVRSWGWPKASRLRRFSRHLT